MTLYLSVQYLNIANRSDICQIWKLSFCKSTSLRPPPPFSSVAEIRACSVVIRSIFTPTPRLSSLLCQTTNCSMTWPNNRWSLVTLCACTTCQWSSHVCEGVGLLHILALRLWRLFIVVCFAAELHGGDQFVSEATKEAVGFLEKRLPDLLYICMYEERSFSWHWRYYLCWYSWSFLYWM